MNDQNIDTANAPKRSIVIAAFNEENRLPRTIESTVEYLTSLGESYEIVIVDDGSTDGTESFVKELLNSNENIHLISLAQNSGKGAAIRTGVMRAEGELILFCDADGATPISEIKRLESALVDGVDISIGSRALSSKEVSVDAHLHRLVLGRVFNLLANILLVPGIADTQCGFKLFRRDAAHEIFSRQKEDGFIFDVELLYLSRKFRFKVSEVAVNWTDQPGSRVRLVNDSVLMFLGLFRILFRSY